MKQKLDKLFQQLSNGKQCHFCNKQAIASHHIVACKNLWYRWDYRNALPVCFDCHFKLHQTTELKNPQHNLTETSWKGVATKEFMLEKKKELKEMIEL